MFIEPWIYYECSNWIIITIYTILYIIEVITLKTMILITQLIQNVLCFVQEKLVIINRQQQQNIEKEEEW